MIRVTDSAAASGSLYGMELANSRLQQLQSQMSTGRQITKPSDNPSGTVQALQLRGALKRNTQYAASANDAIGWLSSADSAYTQIVQQVQKVRTLVVQGLNQGANTGTSNQAIAQQITAIRTSIIALANSSYNGRPIFGGTTTGQTAITDNGTSSGSVTYSDDGGAIYRQVGDSTRVQINQGAQSVFVTPANGAQPSIDLFQLLGTIANDLNANAINTDTTGYATGNPLSDIDAALQTISSAQAKEGATYNQVQAAQAAQTSTNLALTSELSNIQDIDLAQQAVAVSTANVNYQAALQTTANIRQESLLNFLN